MKNTPRLLAFVGLLVATGASGGERLSNGGMESPFVEGIAHGWGKNCYGRNVAVFSPGPPRSGEQSQRVECRSYESGAVQFRAPLAIVKGKHYRISCCSAPTAAWQRSTPRFAMVRPRTRSTSARLRAGRRLGNVHVRGHRAGVGQRGRAVFLAPARRPRLALDRRRFGDRVRRERPRGASAFRQHASQRQLRGRLAAFVAFDAHAAEHRRRKTVPRPAVPPLGHQLIADTLRQSTGRVRRPQQADDASSGRSGKRQRHAHRDALAGREAEGTSPVLRSGANPRPIGPYSRPAAPCRRLPTERIMSKSRSTARRGARYGSTPLGSNRTRRPARCVARRPLEASLSCDRPAHVFHQGRPVTLRASGVQRRRPAAGRRAHLPRERLRSQVVCEAPLEMNLDAQRGADAAVTLPIPGTGVFLAELLDGATS